MVIKTKEIFNGEANAVSYTIHKEEIGRIGLTVESDYFQIKYFMVKEKKRNTGVGRKLLGKMIKEVKKAKGTKIIVFPNSEPYEGDKPIKPEKLYKIYEHLGFDLENKKADLKKPNNKMIMILR